MFLGSSPTHGSSTTTTRGIVEEAGGEAQLLAHAVAVALDQLVADLEDARRSSSSSSHRASRPFSGHPVEPGDEAHQLAAGQPVVEERGVGDVAEEPLGGERLVLDVVAADQRPAGGRPLETGEHLDRRRLAGAVGAEEAEELALGDRELEVADGGLGAEVSW